MLHLSKALTIVWVGLAASGSCLAAPTYEIPSTCLTPNASLAVGYPGVLEANVGITAGRGRVNAHMACSGPMLDVGANLHAVRLATGYRAFQRYDWPVALQLNGFVYRGYREDSPLPGTCPGFELGYGMLMTMLRVGAGYCSKQEKSFLQVQFGVFY